MLSKAEFATVVAKRLKMKPEEAAAIIDLIFDEYLKQVRKGPVKTPIGTLVIRKLKGRKGFNLGTGEAVTYPPSRALRLLVLPSVTQAIKNLRGRAFSSRETID